jgi:hypothetical protein
VLEAAEKQVIKRDSPEVYLLSGMVIWQIALPIVCQTYNWKQGKTEGNI